jgi:hypothetical protein
MSDTESDVDTFVTEEKCLNQSIKSFGMKRVDSWYLKTVSGEIVW